jgi:predicted alpha/beta-fold hydrolase
MRFTPAPFLKNGHLQTIFPTLFKNVKKLKVEREIFELDDGDFVECIWHKKPTVNSRQPIIILFHGLAGSFNSPYIQRAMDRFERVGYSVVLMHFRGCSDLPNRLPRSYHSGDTADARSWISYLKTKYPDNPLISIGYSLGGNMLLKLLGEWGKNSPLLLAAAISAPMQLESSANAINKGFSKLYQYRLMYSLKKQLDEKYNRFDMESLIGLSREEVSKLSTFWEFDEAYTAPVHGFKDAKDYYKRSSSKQFLKDIRTKTLIIHAKDDPFMNDEVIPKRSELSNSVQLELYDHGGHVGFVSGSLLSFEYWLEDRILEFITDIRHLS